jgi:Mg-chelatase subunit ChlI
MVDLLLPLQVVEGCPYHCAPDATAYVHDACRQKVERGEPLVAVECPVPLIELPLGATEDRLVGSLHFERAIHAGERVFEPGLLAKANRGILYVDEVNLPDDHLVDLLLDTSASGVNRVEREGISELHPATFILIGTMNPEEGELRPQFLDRFGLCIGVAGEPDVKQRSELIRRRMAFEKDPTAFCGRWDATQSALRQQIANARLHLTEVSVSDEILDAASALAIKVGAQGHRAEITMTKVAMALAAFQERDYVTHADIIEAATMAIPHRLDRFIECGGVDLPEELQEALTGLFGEKPFVHGGEETDKDDNFPAFGLDDNIFPGSCACGSPTFTFLKKNIQHCPSRRRDPTPPILRGAETFTKA